LNKKLKKKKKNRMIYEVLTEIDNIHHHILLGYFYEDVHITSGSCKWIGGYTIFLEQIFSDYYLNINK